MDFIDDAADWDESSLPDAVGLVVECADLIAVFAADRARRVDAYRREAMAEVADLDGGLDSVLGRSLRLELAAALRITEHAASRLLAFAEALVHRYPTALEALGRARLTEQHAQILVDALDAVPSHEREALIDRAVEMAEEYPVGVFRRRLHRFVEAARATTLAERHGDAIAARHVRIETVGDGMAWLHVFAPAVEIHAIHGRVTSIGRSLAGRDGDERTLDQVRADIVCDLLIDGEAACHPVQARGIRATVAVTVPVLALLGCEDGIAEVEGVGPVSIERARDLCGGEAGWMRVLTHPETGMVLSVGRERYRPPRPLRDLVRWRADRCMAPGCGMPASRCEIDHSIDWQYGGKTELVNLAPLCTGHHTVRHNTGWTVSQARDGALEWISPTGRAYRVEPERRVPVFRDAA